MDVRYRVDISPLVGELGSSVDVRGSLDMGSYRVGDDDIELVSPATFDVTVTNSGTAFVAMGSVGATVKLACARCATGFEQELSGEVEGFYIRPGDEEGIPSEQEYELVESDDHVDIAPAVLAGLVFETPFVALCDEGCKGLCPLCGADLNEETCSCGERIDPLNPFAALAALELDTDERDAE